MSNKIAIITGIRGQVASYLADYLIAKDYKVVGVERRVGSPDYCNIKHLFDKSNFILEDGDITDFGSISRVVKEYEPELFFNAAAQSVSSDSICPILFNGEIRHITLEDLWNKLDTKNRKIRIEKFKDSDVEVIDLPKNKSIKALGYYNGAGHWFAIKQISRHKWDQQIVEMDQKFGSIKVTPNHSILDTMCNIKSPIDNPWLLNLRKINYNKKLVNNINLFRILKTKHSDDKYMWDDDSGFIGKILYNLNGDKLLSFVKFVGAYISEGSLSYNSANKEHNIFISNGNKNWLDEISKCLSDFSLDRHCFTISKKDGYKDVFNLVIKSKTLFNLLKKICGKGSYNKKIPSFIFNLDNIYISAMLAKMIEGDGCMHNNKFRYTTSSYKLACQLGLIFSMLKHDYTVHSENGVKHKYYHFRECGSYQYNQGVNGKKIKFTQYNGYVYDISVEEVHNFTIGVGNIVVHNSHVGASWNQPSATCDVNFTGVCNCLESIRLTSPKTRFLQSSTSEVYGDVITQQQSELTPARPRSPYAAAKYGAESLVKVYRDSYNIFACYYRGFNTESPRRGKQFVTRKITDWIGRTFNIVDKNIENFISKGTISTENAYDIALSKGIIQPLRLGNLEAKRDWSHSIDIVHGMYLIISNDKPDDYVLASGKTWSIKDFLSEAFGKIGIKDWQKFVIIDPKFYRPADVELLCGDASKAKNVLGWEPKISFRELVHEMVNFDILNNSDER